MDEGPERWRQLPQVVPEGKMRVNIGYWISKNARLYPNKNALICAGRSVTYRDLDRRVNRLANALDGMGLAAGDRVAALMLNSIEYIELLFACAKKGLVFVPLNFRLSVPELQFILGDCTPRALFFDPVFGKQAEALSASVPSLVNRTAVPLAGGGEYDALLERWPETEALDERHGGDDLLLIMYTAGTTGRAKGVMLSHHNCFFQTINGWAFGNSPDAVTLVVLPLFHVGGLNGSVTPMIHIGATTILIPKFDPADVLELVERWKVVGIMAVPTVYQMLLDHPDFGRRDLSSLEVLLSGGAPLPHALLEAYHGRGFEMRQGYGLTEASPGVTGMGPGDCRRKPGTVGKRCLYTEVEVMDDEGRILSPGQTGEVVARGPNIMLGYWNLPEETAKTIVDGWLRTGDLGRFDEDGFLTIVGRKKEMIISGGENVYPAEIEQLLTNHPDVGMAAVVGIKDPMWGEVPVAFVTPAPGRTPVPEAILDYLGPRLARYKVPRQVHVRDVLPISAAGKILKRQLAEELSANRKD